MLETASVIKKIRKETGFSQKQLAEALKSDQAVISNYERGKTKPAGDMFERILRFAKENDIEIELPGYAPQKKSVSNQDITLKNLIAAKKFIDKAIEDIIENKIT